MSGPTGYSLADYGWMIDQAVRSDAYVEALRRAVKPGHIVYDIGSGPGIFAIVACRFGAAKAVAIETDPSVYLAPTLAQDAGVGDRLEIFARPSTEFRPTARADVIISDLRGITPLYERHIPSIVDCRERLLKPNGTLIPAYDRIFLALVESERAYRTVEFPWSQNRLDLPLDTARSFVANAPQAPRFDEDELLSEGLVIETIDYRTVCSADFSMPYDLIASRSGTAHGLACWFDTELVPGVGYSTAPGSACTVYRSTFFPFPQPVSLSTGDRVSGEIVATLEGRDYTWSWRSAFARSVAKEPLEFRQSSAFATAFSPTQLQHASERYVPCASESLALDRFILGCIDGSRSLGDIAALAHANFPDKLPSIAAALTHVADLAARYDRS